ncbi:MAG: carbon starvation protein A, partial [Ottowia sp.]|nr:carbon starvation protein A [Ottowia sp.]
MVTFLIALLTLIVGYNIYGRFVERVFAPDSRLTPAQATPDGVDYIPLPTWKATLIQLLNIAGLGPIFGALAGACFGPIVFFWIVLGTL